MFVAKTPFAKNTKEYTQLMDLFINFLVKLNLPLHFVDEPAFVNMLSGFNNRFKLPCRQTMSKSIIPSKAASAKAILKNKLRMVDYCSLTCDGWTSEGGHSYLGLTVHYIESFQLKSYLLALKHMTKKHTSEVLLDELNSVLDSWELRSKVLAISADGAYNIRKVNHFTIIYYLKILFNNFISLYEGY